MNLRSDMVQSDDAFAPIMNQDDEELRDDDEELPELEDDEAVEDGEGEPESSDE